MSGRRKGIWLLKATPVILGGSVLEQLEENMKKAAFEPRFT